jgi:hypothetical protein
MVYKCGVSLSFSGWHHIGPAVRLPFSQQVMNGQFDVMIIDTVGTLLAYLLYVPVLSSIVVDFLSVFLF